MRWTRERGHLFPSSTPRLTLHSFFSSVIGHSGRLVSLENRNKKEKRKKEREKHANCVAHATDSSINRRYRYRRDIVYRVTSSIRFRSIRSLHPSHFHVSIHARTLVSGYVRENTKISFRIVLIIPRNYCCYTTIITITMPEWPLPPWTPATQHAEIIFSTNHSTRPRFPRSSLM